MGRLYLRELSGRFYCCRACDCHLARTDDVISKDFRSRDGKAYLFESVVNVTEGVLEYKPLLTGYHTVADIYCNVSHELLGWKYEKADRDDQKYKEGKFVLECAKIKHGDESDTPGSAGEATRSDS